MRPHLSAWSTFFAANPTVVAQTDLYLFALTSGTTLRYTGGNGSITVPSVAFADTHSLNHGAQRTFALGPGFGRSKVSTKVGVEPTELDIDIYAGPGDLIGSTTFAAAVQEGLFDGATVELDRLLGATPQDTSLGALTWFYGQVAECDIGRSKITMKVKSLLNLLATQQMPRRLFQAPCNHIFGAPMCGYDRTLGENALGASTGYGAQAITAAGGSDQAHIVAGFTPSPVSAYINGTIISVAGANAGASRSVANIGSGNVYVSRPWLSPVTVGDTFSVEPGCDHTVTTCDSVLNNLLRYGGFPYIPPPEASV